jgi:opacity protein-like surface antigen
MGLDLKILGSISEKYDDNINFSRIDPKEDYVTTLGFGLSGNYEGKRRVLNFDARANERFNANNSDIKTSSQTVKVSFRNDFTVYDRLNLSYAFLHSYTPQSFEEALERIRARQERFTHNVNLNYRRVISEHFSTNASYNYHLTKYSDDLRKDQYSNGLGFGINYKPSIEVTYLLSYRYSRSRFGNEIHTANVGVRRYLTKRLYVNGRVGGTYSSSRTTNNRGLNLDVTFTNEIDEVSWATLSISRDDQFSDVGGDVSTAWQIQGQYSRQLLEKLNGNFHLYYGKNKFDDTNFKQELFGFDAMLAYEILENLTGDVRYVYGKLNSSDGISGYSKNAIQVGLTTYFE